jgi:hypothetical protein
VIAKGKKENLLALSKSLQQELAESCPTLFDADSVIFLHVVLDINCILHRSSKLNFVAFVLPYSHRLPNSSRTQPKFFEHQGAAQHRRQKMRMNMSKQKECKSTRYHLVIRV